MKQIFNLPCNHCDNDLIMGKTIKETEINVCSKCGQEQKDFDYQQLMEYQKYLHTQEDIEWKGYVVFYDHTNLPNSLTEIGRTIDMDSWMAADYYANTPNPASQLITYKTEEEKALKESILQENIKDPEWLSELHDCI